MLGQPRIKIFPYGDERVVRKPGKDATVEFIDVQHAIQACMEALGSRSETLNVVLPVTCSPHTAAGCLRAGAVPFMVDIDPETLQMDPAAFVELAQEIGSGAVILTKPGGMAVDPRLLELFQENVYILDTQHHCTGQPVDPNALFTVMQNPHTGASWVTCRYPEQAKDLFNLRNGYLGLSAAPFRFQDTSGELPDGDKEVYEEMLGDRFINKEGEVIYNVLVRVTNARTAQAQLNDEGIDSLLIAPLHQIPGVGDRWADAPNYPNAELVAQTVIAVPFSGTKDAKRICTTLLELENNT